MNDVSIIKAQEKLDSAFAYFKQGNYQAAIRDCTESIRLNPKLADAYFTRGRIYGSLGDERSAMLDFRETIRLEPDNVSAHFYLGNILINQNDSKGGIRELSEAIRLNPAFQEAYFSRALANLNINDSAAYKRDMAESERLKEISVKLSGINQTEKIYIIRFLIANQDNKTPDVFYLLSHSNFLDITQDPNLACKMNWPEANSTLDFVNAINPGDWSQIEVIRSKNLS